MNFTQIHFQITHNYQIHSINFTQRTDHNRQNILSFFADDFFFFVYRPSRTYHKHKMNEMDLIVCEIVFVYG